MSSHMHIDNKNKDILIVGEGPSLRWYYINSRS